MLFDNRGVFLRFHQSEDLESCLQFVRFHQIVNIMLNMINRTILQFKILKPKKPTIKLNEIRKNK